jgi:O-antigen/teichoic acid export membrane protein
VTADVPARGRGAAVIRSAGLSMVGLVALGLTRLVHGSLVSRATDPETYAVVGKLIGLAMTVSLVVPGGLASAASRYISFHIGGRDPAAARAAYRVLTAAGYVTALLFAVIVALIAPHLHGVSSSDVVAVAALTAVYSAYSVAKGALYGFDRIVPYVWLEVAGSVLAVGLTVAVVVTGAHAYLVPLIIGNSVLMLGALVVLRPRPTVPSEQEPMATVLARLKLRDLGIWVGLASLGGGASAGLLQLLPVLAGRFTSRVEVAYFVAAVTLVAPLAFLPRAFTLALFPAMARAHGAGDVDVVRRHADVSTRALLTLLAPIFAAGILVAPEVLALFGGSQYAAGAPVLRLLLIATYAGSIQVGAVNSLSSGDAVRIPVYAAVVGAVVGLAALVPLGHLLGSAGVGLSYLLAVAITSGVPLWATWRRFGMAWTGPMIRSFAVLLGALALAEVLDAAGPHGSAATVIDILAAGLAVAGAAAVLGDDIRAVLAARHG